MAIKIKSTNQYIKLNRDECVFYPYGISLSMVIFTSEEERNEYYRRCNIISKLNDNCNSYIKNLEKAFLNHIESTYNISIKELEENQLENKEILDKIEKDKFIIETKEKINTLSLELSELNLFFGANPYAINCKLTQLNKFKEFGLEDCMLSNKIDIGSVSILVDGYANQNFSYECLYGELKKLYPNDYIDC